MTLEVWMAGLTQQFFAILLGGSIAVGWGRSLANWVDGVITDWQPNLVAYIDVPQSSGATANYYIGPPPPLRMPPGAIGGLYYTLNEVPPGYTRYQFDATRRIHSRRQLFICMMTALQTQTGSHLVIGHLFAPSRNSWYPKEDLGKFTLMTRSAW